MMDQSETPLLKPVSWRADRTLVQHLSRCVLRLSTFFLAGVLLGSTAQAQKAPITFRLYDRTRVNATQWFSAMPEPEQYGHVDQLLRLSLEQKVGKVDWLAEVGQAAELFLPSDAVSPIAAQGQLGLGGSYYAANGNVRFPAAASLRSAYVRGHLAEDTVRPRLGRFEFFEGAETAPKDTTLLWLQSQRMQQRLIGNFGFTTAQRSFDGVELKLVHPKWDITAMGARAVGGVFNMNANPELNVDAQYLAYTRYLGHDHVIVRGFAVGYHDGRTGVVKTDNRTAAARALDHGNIRVGSYGASMIAAAPVGAVTFDALFWGVLQNGRWGVQDHRAGAVSLEGGVRFEHVATKPWVRGGWDRTSGDNDPNDNKHGTFFQVLPTPRVYARFPFFNMMNLSDSFVQVVDKPVKKLEVRADWHSLKLTSAQDFWYQGGGAFDGKVFGFTGRPSNGLGDFSSLADISADWTFNPSLTLTGYYGRAGGGRVVQAIYPRDTVAQFGYFEMVYRFNHTWGSVKK
jgi:hypothetical protein